MIFVTVGTSHFPFKRLLEEICFISKILGKKEEIIIQSGVTPIPLERPGWLKIYPFLPFHKMVNYYKEADLIITHGGLASIFQPLLSGNGRVIVVPRRQRYSEHVDDHQWEFAKYLKRKYGIVVIEDIKQLRFWFKEDHRPQIIRKMNYVSSRDGANELCKNLISFTEKIG